MISSLFLFPSLLFAVLAPPALPASGKGPVQTQVFELDLGEIRKGDAVKAWARMTNYTEKAITITQVTVPHGWSVTAIPFPARIEPRSSLLFELPAFPTSSFTGPLSKSMTFLCTPGCSLGVQLYAAQPRAH